MADDTFRDFTPLDHAIADLTERMSPAARKALATRVAVDLQKANAARMHENVEPDGGAMEPRKLKKSGKIRTRRLRDRVTGLRRTVRQQKMFLRAAAPRYLRKETTAGEAQVGFVGAMARIMRVHQYGLRDTVTRDPSSPPTDYPARQVIGFADADRAQLLERISEQLQP
ncbi:phage virion morphogenesis protein [Sphingomonas sp. ac-8]|uniref:phage virion morphogenesis protein n=1 Tax=Sphingomonas sp. ac-8 TaxID=3242977 RepID=UPI003A80C6AD